MQRHAASAPDRHAGSIGAFGEADMIRKSHERSQTFGLSASMRPDYDVLGRADLAQKLEQNRTLYTHAFPVMATLYEQIVNTHSMVVLTDADGLILHSLGDDDFLRRAEKVALRAGAVWSEERQGTNAIGMAIAECAATTVHGDEHYLHANRFLTCSSAPILDPYGRLAGVLDVTGDCRSYHQHTLALAKMSAQMIENHLFSSTFTEALRIHFHSRPEFIGTLMEGIAAFTLDGRFLSANRSAQFQFGMPLAALHAHTLSSLFGVSAATLIDRACHANPTPLPLQLHSGVAVFSRVELRRMPPATHAADRAIHADTRHASDMRAVPQPVTGRGAASGEPKLSGLRYLSSGDERVAALIERVRKVIGKSIPILIGGETGTGKDLLAAAIHHDSPRRAGPFVAVNCASIPDTLIEAELFGYEPGAFTGAARRGAIGKILQADGGTLFLDEIGDMPYALQSRLLRALQERVVHPLGSTKAIAVDFALVCATNRNLRDRVARGEFREDLYYRINGLAVTLPPLRERTDLANTVDKILRAENFAARPVTTSPDVLALFAQHRWPGNFRQLTNVLRTASAMLDDDETTIDVRHLPHDFLEELEAAHDDPTLDGDAHTAPGAGAHAGAGPVARADAGTMRRSIASGTGAATAPATASHPRTGAQHAPAHAMDKPGYAARLDDIASSAIAAALDAHHGNVSAAARALGVSRNTIYRRMVALSGLERPAATPSDAAPPDTAAAPPSAEDD